jgi:predicted acetyltransferase
MRVEVIRATVADQVVVGRLLQLYQYDFGEIEGGDVADDGLYHYVDPERPWQDPAWQVFLVKADSRLAGFAFVRDLAARPGDPPAWEMDEFFILRKYRRRNLGEYLARYLFDRFAGAWVVKQTRHNDGARAFWRKVIGRYTGGRFAEVLYAEGMYPASVQSFDSPARG